MRRIVARRDSRRGVVVRRAVAWQPDRVLVRSDRCYRFTVPAQRVWEEATAIDRYASWWPWLRRFDATTFDTGAVWTCVVKPPLPYTVRFSVTLQDVVHGSHVRARIDGDVTGTALLTLTGADEGCEVRLVSALAPRSGVLRALAALARPAVRFGHDWVLDSGARQFRATALPGVDPDPVR
jgi:uncharacterized protein YndB with AHSA1/START domain